VDAPHKAGAIEAALRLAAVWRRAVLALATPDVRVADEANGRLQDSLLPGRQRGEREGRRLHLERGNLPARQAEDPRGRERGLGACRRLAREKLEVVLRRRMVRPQAEEACDRLRAETSRRREPGGARRLLEDPCR